MSKEKQTRIVRAVIILFILQVLVGIGTLNPDTFWFKAEKIQIINTR